MILNLKHINMSELDFKCNNNADVNSIECAQVSKYAIDTRQGHLQ